MLGSNGLNPTETHQKISILTNGIQDVSNNTNDKHHSNEAKHGPARVQVPRVSVESCRSAVGAV